MHGRVHVQSKLLRSADAVTDIGTNTAGHTGWQGRGTAKGVAVGHGGPGSRGELCSAEGRGAGHGRPRAHGLVPSHATVQPRQGQRVADGAYQAGLQGVCCQVKGLTRKAGRVSGDSSSNISGEYSSLAPPHPLHHKPEACRSQRTGHGAQSAQPAPPHPALTRHDRQGTQCTAEVSRTRTKARCIGTGSTAVLQ